MNWQKHAIELEIHLPAARGAMLVPFRERDCAADAEHGIARWTDECCLEDCFFARRAREWFA